MNSKLVGFTHPTRGYLSATARGRTLATNMTTSATWLHIRGLKGRRNSALGNTPEANT
jgi:hypothetical protein